MTESINAQFKISNNKNVSGVLSDAKRYKFNCWSSEFFAVESHSNIYGRTQDNKILSLLNCLGNESRCIAEGSVTYSNTIQPHIALTGKKRVEPDSDKFCSISLVVGNSHALLRRFTSFGYISFPDDGLVSQLNAQEHAPLFAAQHNPTLAYFNGDFDIFSQNTKLGVISASNHISVGDGFSSDGVSIRNKVGLTVKFHTSKTLNEALNIAHKVSLLLRFIAGENVFFKDMLVSDGSENNFQLLYNTYSWGEDLDSTKSGNPLIDISSEDFPQFLDSWFSHVDRDIVRYSFYDGFLKGRSYSSDRLINAANIFDIFPSSTGSSKKVLKQEETETLERLKQHIKKEFSELDDIKCSLLNSIGFLTRTSLKERVNERITVIENYLESRGFDLDDIDFVLRLAIKARNYHVHGSEFKQLTLRQMYDFQILFTCFFEFIYAISELIECGWRESHISHLNTRHPVFDSERYLKSEITALKETVKYNQK
ncbi:HEPN domain-containing protein [Shewanella baltica]|uniref:ApeA N-terminal domain 1-containing protein n=1 Tax=Shewanella baltica TaxID=62322 RepID=UPI0002F29CAD|nr:HEPN domain-containing protein [Shewanella baltica]